jgi:2-hydroxy-3-oxopropionate reductase
MGTPMARHRVVAYDIVPSRRTPWWPPEQKQACPCKDMAQRSSVLISMVPDSPGVEKVDLGPEGVLNGVSAGMLLIDMSSISPVTAVKVAQAAEAKGCQVLDACPGRKCVSITRL